jgi:hypothetical protein
MTTISVKPAAFIARATMSAVVDLTGTTAIVGLVMPTTWTPALVSIQGSPDGTTFYDLHDGTPGTELLFNVSPNSIVMLNPNRLRCCKAVKLRSGPAAAPVIQAVACQFGIVVEGP